MGQYIVRPSANDVAALALNFSDFYFPSLPQPIHNQNNYVTAAPITSDANQGITYNQGGLILPKTALGTPVTSWLTFIDGSYSNLNDGSTIQLPMFTLDTCIISVSQTKNIVSTQVNGSNGSVKTYLGMSDYKIKVNGVLFGQNGIHPTPNTKILQNICTAPVSLYISCPYLNEIFGINYVVISDFSIDQTEGGYSQQKYSIEMLSDDNSDSIITTNIKSSTNPYVA